MSAIDSIFERINKITHDEGQSSFAEMILNNVANKNDKNIEKPSTIFEVQMGLLSKIFKEIDDLAAEIKRDETVLISVRNQKLLRTCFQLVTSLGFFPSLIPGLGISLSKRCSWAAVVPSIKLSDEQKYEVLVSSTDFFTRCYEIPVLKNIILTFHMSDFLAALIQLSFAPLKKPGTYDNFIMTQEMYEKLNSERLKYVKVYDHLVSNCFQPILMKELLVLQSVMEPPPPMFVKRVLAKEMSRRLLANGGLLSLIRCFIESYNNDTGLEWKKIDMICKIVTSKHGNASEDNYLKNICSQLVQILTLNNIHYLTTAVACILGLNKKFPQSESVQSLVKEIFHAFDCKHLISKSNLPGTIVLTPQEVERKIAILHCCISATALDYSNSLLTPNLYTLFLIGVKCKKNEDMKVKLKDIMLKILEQLDKDDILSVVKKCLYGDPSLPVCVEEYEVGVSIKCRTEETEYPMGEAVLYFLNLVKLSTENDFIKSIFKACLQILIELSKKRRNKNELLVSKDDDLILDDADEQYANILQLLSEISTLPKVVSALKHDPSIVLDFIEYFILSSQNNSTEEECVTIALVLLNTILSNSTSLEDLVKRLNNLIPVMKTMSQKESSFNYILCEEALSLLSSQKPKHAETEFAKAISDVHDELLPVRAHGIIQLTKLIDNKDPETISKKHYIFCLLQEQLKDADSYLYLSAINGIASLGTHCTEDVLQVLCREFLQVSSEQNFFETKDDLNKFAELRMKTGDIIVKVTKRLGEMAIVHKTILLNTMLCGCRDDDPLIRTSALSNLAEIALVIHYRLGTIIYEVLLCIWSIIETDKAVECRRAAVMVVASLLKGLGKDTLVELKENLLPVYRTLKNLYKDTNEDSVVRLHAQIALEELNDTVRQLILPELNMEKQFVMEKAEDDIVFK